MYRLHTPIAGDSVQRNVIYIRFFPPVYRKVDTNQPVQVLHVAKSVATNHPALYNNYPLMLLSRAKEMSNEHL
jgi:hypothetical protein